MEDDLLGEDNDPYDDDYIPDLETEIGDGSDVYYPPGEPREKPDDWNPDCIPLVQRRVPAPRTPGALLYRSRKRKPRRLPVAAAMSVHLGQVQSSRSQVPARSARAWVG